MSRWVKAGVVESRFEWDRTAQALERAGIPYVMKSFLDTAYDGLYLPQKGWGAVMVPEGFVEEAREVLIEVKDSFREGGEKEDEDQ